MSKFGEPFSYKPESDMCFGHIVDCDGTALYEEQERRLIECSNAMANVSDPAAFMAEVRELLQYVKSQWASEAELECSCCECEMNNRLDAMLARLEPFEIGAPDNKPQWSATQPEEQGWYFMRTRKRDVKFCLIAEEGEAWSMGEAYMSEQFIKDSDVEFWPVRIEEPR